MTRDTIEMLLRLQNAGITLEDAYKLRRIAMTLHRWHELECGSASGGIERDEVSNKCYWVNAMTGKRFPTADRETGALKRLSRIMAGYPGLTYYVQTDPRGASLYILRQQDVVGELDSCYSRGIAVYK